MDKVKVDRDTLLEIVKKNRAKHVAIATSAEAGYRKRVITKLTKLLADAKSGRKIIQRLDMIEPMNRSEDYDQAISMLKMSVETEVELSDEAYRQLVMDNWNWKQAFNNSNLVSGYTKAR